MEFPGAALIPKFLHGSGGSPHTAMESRFETEASLDTRDRPVGFCLGPWIACSSPFAVTQVFLVRSSTQRCSGWPPVEVCNRSEAKTMSARERHLDRERLHTLQPTAQIAKAKPANNSYAKTGSLLCLRCLCLTAGSKAIRQR